MSDSFDVQTYRDFAENRGIFGINAKDVAIYDKEGNYVGSIPKMMNFDGLADAHAGEAALVGGPASSPPCPMITITRPLRLPSVLEPRKERRFMTPTGAW